MSEARARVLVAESDPAAIAVYREALGSEPGIQLTLAGDALDAMRACQQEAPDLTIAGSGLLAADDWALARQLHHRADERGIIVMVSDAGDCDRRHEALMRGVDEFLRRPVDVASVLAKVRGMLRLKRAYDRLRLDRDEMERLHVQLSERFEQLMKLLVSILDMSLPGAADRGIRVARLADRVADKFSVPSELRKDLDIAARLYELGRLVMITPESHSTVGTDAWAVAVATRDILDRVEGLKGAAEVVGSMFENWDGTGMPSHLLQGQIPLRSRILRAVLDYDGELEGGRGARPAEVMARLMEHKAARYDPLVLVHLESVVDAGAGASEKTDRRVIPIASLETGMVLADDLYTASGIKLLARGTRLGAAAIESLLRRHRVEPLLHGACVKIDKVA
ncbi:MAG TPA: HD domain-containing phosphohydrolase [Candidatus Sulfotelmatobacter sp.]|nr:HD domain-containing phosphohydrolase [Candidatus Sulfotelmatobacter sp.]